VEIYFSIIQWKVLTPMSTPFQWKFDRAKLRALLAKIEAHQQFLSDAKLHSSEEAA
jgi:hypothetical protein